MSYSHLSLHWRHNERDSVSNHQSHDCLLNCLFRRRSKKTSKLRATGLCAGNSPVTGEFPAQKTSNAENVSIWWFHDVKMWVCGLHKLDCLWHYSRLNTMTRLCIVYPDKLAYQCACICYGIVSDHWLDRTWSHRYRDMQTRKEHNDKLHAGVTVCARHPLQWQHNEHHGVSNRK